MAQQITSRHRRVAGVIFLIGSGSMLVVDDMILGPKPNPLGFLFYWGLCFALVVAALGTAFLDVLFIQRYWYEEKKRLVECNLKEIRSEVTKRENRGTTYTENSIDGERSNSESD